jgi:hypothetical protein
MEHAEPSLDQWRLLYDLAAKVYALAPWEYMEETDLLGVTDPVSGETNFVSVMGALGEHLALALYLGKPGLRGFWDMTRQPSTSDPGLLLETPQLQLTFEDRQEKCEVRLRPYLPQYQQAVDSMLSFLRR